MKMLFVLIAALALVGCSARDMNRNQAVSATDEFIYTQDMTTGLCYSWSMRVSSDSHSNVPCTPEVMQQVKRLDRR